MKEIYTIEYKNKIVKYQQCYLFYDEKILNKFASNMESNNKYCAVFKRFDKALFLLINYDTTESYKRGEFIIQNFARNYHIENTNSKTRQNKKGNN